MTQKKKIYCPECCTTKLEGEFYTSKDKVTYPTGRLPVCKSCRTLMVNNWDKDTFIDILKECDVPFVAKEWNKLLAKYIQEPEKCSGVTIIGKYLAKMQLQQFREDRFADSEKLQKEIEDEIEVVLQNQGYDEAAIEQAKIDSRKLLPAPKLANRKKTPEELGLIIAAPPVPAQEPIATVNDDGTVNNPEMLEDYFASEDDVSYENDLTDDDKKYLRLKWGKTYSWDELIRLEKLYIEMEESFDIQNAGHRDTLVKVCKTSLKSEQLLDIGDVESAQKMIRMYNDLMRAGKFTAVQNKAENGEFVDSVSELVEMCEKQGYIERYYTEEPKDKADLTLLDMQRYTTTLVKGESNLTNLIEEAIKQNMKDDKAAAEHEDEDISDEELFMEIDKEVLTDEDFSDFYDSEIEDIDTDKSLLNELGGS